jgi:hypothetical protein
MSKGTTHRASLALAAALITVAGCDTLPTDLAATGDLAAEAAAVQEVWTQLPSTLDLEAQSLNTLDQGALSGDAAIALLDAGDLAAEAQAALEGGAEADASRLGDASDTLATRGFLATHGSVTADAVLSGVEDAAARIELALGAELSTEARLRIAAAAEALARARAARAAADHAGTLLHATRAATALRWLDPQGKATAAVELAFVFLDRAERLAGNDPEPPIARALARADAFCSAARRALDNDRWRLAVTEAHACARLARTVIVRLSAGIDPDVLAERAEEVVANASALFERATEQAGPNPELRIELLLGEAEAYLVRARTAFGEERWRAAIGFGGESAARSLRVLRLLHASDVSPVELRATAAVELAMRYGARVEAVIDVGTAPAIVDAALRTDGLVVDARAALDAGEWRLAWSLARRAITLYARILLALA